MPNLTYKSLKIVVFGNGYLGFEISQKLKKLGHQVLIATRQKNFNKKKGFLYFSYANNFRGALKGKDLVDAYLRNT